MTSPERPLVTGRGALLVRLVAIAAVFAMMISGFLCLAGLTNDRVGTGIIAGGVAFICVLIV